MKMCGINVISTYIFWIHHEEEEGVFDFSGRKNLRKFIELCQKHHIYVILRIGPFDHGEVRNGGLPDWLYGKSFEVRKLNDGFLYYVKRLYTEIAGQVQGLLYKDGGPVIAAQIDNEYMHSSATWEITTGISDEWIFGGDDGEAYMYALRDLAKECGIVTPFYTCTYNYRFILPYVSEDTDNTIFDLLKADTKARQIPVRITQTARTKYELSFPDRFMNGLKDALLCVDYTGDIGSAFINGDMINDNFCNHNTWEIGLRTFARRLRSILLPSLSHHFVKAGMSTSNPLWRREWRMPRNIPLN